MTKNNFKQLICVAALLYVSLILLELYVPFNVSQELFDAYQNHLNRGLYGYIRQFVDYFAIGIALLLAVAAYGLYMFKNWAPSFAMIATLVSFIPYLFIGTLLTGSVSMIILGCMDLIWGAILMLTFLDPYSKWFKSA